MVSKKAGLLGVSDLSNDMRDLREAIKEGNAKARLAVDKFTWTIAKWIGSYVAELGGLDMLVFTGGIGENDIASRAEICAGLGALGIVVDADAEQCARRSDDFSREFAGDGARDSAGRRSDYRESRGAAAGPRRMSASGQPLDPRDSSRLFYTGGFACGAFFMSVAAVPIGLQSAFPRQPCAALRGACWRTLSPSFCGERWCGPPGRARAAATTGRSATAR